MFRESVCLLMLGFAGRLTVGQALLANQRNFTPEIKHGTCAVLVENGGNAAFVIDSAISPEMAGARSFERETGCKAFLHNSKLLVATVGLAASGTFFLTKWDANASAKEKLGKVSDHFTAREIDTAMREWGSDLLAYLRLHPDTHQPDGEVASLWTIFSLDKSLHFYKERLLTIDDHVSRDDEGSLRLDLPNEGAAVFFGGACRNFVSISGKRAKPISDQESAELAALVSATNSERGRSSQELKQDGMALETLLAQMTRKYDQQLNAPAEIAPPYQSAVIEAGSETWDTSFVAPCEADSSGKKEKAANSSRR